MTILQFREDLSDRRAADAVRARIDWKYLLGLELTDPAFDGSVLCKFRSRLLAGGGEEMLLDTLLDRCKTMGLLMAGDGSAPTRLTCWRSIRATTRLECAIDALHHVLNCLAIVAPDWLRDHSPSDWVNRYGRRPDESRLPSARGDRQAFAGQVGQDGHTLLAAAYNPVSPAWLAEVPAGETLRRVWLQQFAIEAGRVRWRTEEEGIPPASRFISSPLDVEARYGKKRSTSWVGYKVHDTDLLPGKHMADTAYVDAELLVDSHREYGVWVHPIGPTRPDYRWQSRASEGFAASDFAIDWDRRRATCPEGRTSRELVAGGGP